ncbi:MAG: DUF1257 domain-containing protein [Planctomycetes bacterium]|nr:DUF1257 domain-containing protein [Planctomycetota bacterium]
MSHFTRVETELRNLVRIRQALEDLGYTVVEGKGGQVRVRGYSTATEEAELAVDIEGSYYNIGLRQTADGTYGLVADWDEIEATTEVRQQVFVQQLTQRYAYHTVVEEAAKAGFKVAEEVTDADGSLRLTVRKWE